MFRSVRRTERGLLGRWQCLVAVKPTVLELPERANSFGKPFRPVGEQTAVAAFSEPVQSRATGRRVVPLLRGLTPTLLGLYPKAITRGASAS